jgi:TrpR-related protein YerC/YecD
MKHHDPKLRSELDKAENSLFDAILLLNTQGEIRKFLTDLCTPAELEAMVDRWGVVLLLKAGLSYRDISQKTGVSVTTIGRVARFIDMGAGGYEIALQRMEST